MSFSTHLLLFGKKLIIYLSVIGKYVELLYHFFAFLKYQIPLYVSKVSRRAYVNCLSAIASYLNHDRPESARFLELKIWPLLSILKPIESVQETLSVIFREGDIEAQRTIW